MRTLLRSLLIVSVTLVVGCAAPIDARPPEGPYMVVERRGTVFPEVVTVLSSLPSPDVMRRFPVLLEVKWGYESQQNGMPTEQEIVRGLEIYGSLDKIVGATGVYAMSRTGDGGRTIYYYVEDPKPLAEPIRKYFDSLLPISVSVTSRWEREWASVREVLDGVQ